MKKAAMNGGEGGQKAAALRWSRRLLGWNDASDAAKEWWKELEELNDDRTSLIMKLAGELLTRQATIEDFFTACLYSGREGVQENLQFLDLIQQDASDKEKEEDPFADDKGPVDPDKLH